MKSYTINSFIKRLISLVLALCALLIVCNIYVYADSSFAYAKKLTFGETIETYLTKDFNDNTYKFEIVSKENIILTLEHEASRIGWNILNEDDLAMGAVIATASLGNFGQNNTQLDSPNEAYGAKGTVEYSLLPGTYYIQVRKGDSWGGAGSPTGGDIFTMSIQLDHTPVNGDVILEPTCTSEGTQQVVCSNCGEVIEEKTLPKISHKSENKIIKEATCTQEGAQKVICSTCGEVLSESTIPITAHTLDGEWVTTLEATCSAEGERIQKCSECHKIAVTEAIPMLNHTFGTPVVLSGNKLIPPIVTEETCEVCGFKKETSSWQYAWIAPLIILSIIIVIVIINKIAFKVRRSKRFTCPYCQTVNHLTDIDFKCINPECNHIFNATDKNGKVPRFAVCPKCRKHTSELVCPRCKKSVPESTAFPKGR
jgi:hypothetical protein